LVSDQIKFEPYEHPAGGWGSLKAVRTYLVREGAPLAGARPLLHQNKSDGFACVSCAWAKPEHPHTAEFGENGAKATAWELTSRRLPAEFFEQHTLASLREWSDHDLEQGGRLTVPMRWDASTDRCIEVSWEDAFAGIGAELRALHAVDPASVVFYASGCASREVSGLRVLAFDIPSGCAAGYFPECNPLLPLAHHAEGSKVPAAKAIPIRLRRTAIGMHAYGLQKFTRGRIAHDTPPH
jgi:anaerobic selenocysteine-containing dehydrogenase